MTEFLLEELRKAVRAPDRRPLIVCGAGVSMQATNGKAPSWAALVKSGIQRVTDIDGNATAWAAGCRQRLDTGGTDAWIAAADEATDRLGGPQNREFAEWLEQEVGGLAIERRDLLDAIIALGCPIATTNYDDVITTATGLPPVSWSDHAGTLRILRDHPHEGILHLHGHWRHPEHVVLGSRSYAAHSADSRTSLLQQIATLDRPTMFIGCSADGLTDPDFARLDSFLSEWQRVAPRRYWLVRQESDEQGNVKPPPSPIMAKQLFPIGLGTDYGALPALLIGLPLPLPAPAPTIDADAAMIRCIDQFEPKPEIFGRDSEVALVVDALLAGKPAVIAGGPGMGKTAVAVTALYDPRVVAQFGRRRVFASLETATEPRTILTKLVETLGVPPSGDEVSLLRILETRAAEAPLAAVLDNAETVFDIDRGESQRLLELVAQISGLSLAVTIRGTAPHVANAVRIDDMPRLASPADRDAFIAIAGDTVAGDPDLPRLLKTLDGHALSISLVAAQASGLPTLKGLREDLEEAQAEMLRRPGEQESRLTSVRASLALSLGSRRMRSLPLARRLVGLLALLPGGLAETDVVPLLGERGSVTRAKANEATACLHQLRLVERRLDRRLRMLTPLRECARLDVPALPADRERLIDRYLTIAAKAGRIASYEWQRVRQEVEAEADNLDPVCCLAVDAEVSAHILDPALRGLTEFQRFSSRASANSLLRVVSRQNGRTPQRQASLLFQLGEIAGARSDHEAATARFEEALALFRSVGHVLGEANCIRSLGEIASLRSDHGAAAAQFEQALGLYRRVGNELGEANCIRSLGDIARLRSDYATAAAQFRQALALYRAARDLQGEAKCIHRLGDIAFSCSEHEAASVQFEQALALCHRIGDVHDEADCIYSLGGIARSRSDHEAAAAQFEQALALYRRIGAVLGEATCIRGLGGIALLRSDYRAAAAQFEQAMALYHRIGVVHGEAHCILNLGEIARSRCDTGTAAAQFEQAMALYRRIEDVVGEANCIYCLGEIALSHSDHDAATARFEQALGLYRQAGRQQGAAGAMIRRGQACCAAGERQHGIADIEAGFALYFRVAEDQDRALPGWRALQRALVCDDLAEARGYREEARSCWTAIGRLDLVPGESGERAYGAMSFARKSSSHPAALRFCRREVFPGASRIRFCAMCLMVQKLAGA